MKFEFLIAIIFGIICNILLGYMFYTINEVPFWAKYIMMALFNVAVGMVFMNYMYKDLEDSNE